MAKSPVRLAATGVGLALLVAMSTARAADPHPARPGKGTAHGHDPKGSTKPVAHDAGSRRAIAGGPTGEETTAGVESAELSALREAEHQLFPQAAPAPGNAWPSELPLRMPGEDAPHVHATGLDRKSVV